MCEHDWQYSDYALHKVCAKCGAVMSYDQDRPSLPVADEVERVYHIADLPDPMGSNRRIKIWGS
jgi:hypothetical protein